ncbi:peroxidase family protein [Rubrobacter marinus]|uniref:peroxidase family protein n=1 Tax=Rubrobacter marinus TaxID=2653852 RepID=UPI00140B042C|nr:peroxidase family protein [Rubrobacter marinus]
MTLDFTSDPSRRNLIGELPNARTPTFDLDSVYGLGPEVHPYLYDKSDRLLVEGREDGRGDLQRRAGTGQGPGEAVAIIGDPRNDENKLVAQVHLVFANLHNRFMERFGGDFETARRFTRWHYQWVVLHDFLPRIVGEDLVDDVLLAGPIFFTEGKRNAIPVEFSVAAYRFGHSQVRPDYVVNNSSGPLPLFALDGDATGNDLRGSTRITASNRIEWRLFFDFNGSNPQPTRLIDTKLSSALFRMFPGPPGGSSDVQPDERLLAFRNLRRGVAMGLPSGEAVANHMLAVLNQTGRPTHGLQILTDEQLGGQPYRDARGQGETPLWYWILAEAGALASGQRLGPVGGRIVAEVLVGLLENDERSFISEDPGWEPFEDLKRNGKFDMAALLIASGDVTAA